jgi:hypothetical protein
MNPPTLLLTLLIGRVVPAPAPAELMAALESVEVNQSDDGDAGFSQGFQLVFRAERDKTMTRQVAFLRNPLLQPGGRVVISVTLGGTPQVLMDGIITHHQFTPGKDARLVVTGKDLSVLMDMLELSLGYPAMPHEVIVAMVLAKYVPFGIVPEIIPAPSSWTGAPIEQVPFQDGTDRTYLRTLAQAHGYIFGIRPGPAPMMNTAYWGPLVKVGVPQKALNVDMGASTNVDSLDFSNDSLTPEQVYGLVHLRDSEIPAPILTVATLGLQPLASQQAMLANQPFVRKTRLAYQGSSPIEALAKAQSTTNSSSEAAVTGTGALNALRYGAILTAPGIVGVRGVGEDYDGYYWIKNVKHQISLGEYKQSFTLTREGTGTTTQRMQ